jgi:hypothetical protein
VKKNDINEKTKLLQNIFYNIGISSLKVIKLIEDLILQFIIEKMFISLKQISIHQDEVN